MLERSCRLLRAETFLWLLHTAELSGFTTPMIVGAARLPPNILRIKPDFRGLLFYLVVVVVARVG